MKTIISISSVLAALTLAALPANAQVTYYGTGNANGTGAADGAGISSVVVNNDASTISFTINSTQPMASWIFYAIEIQNIGGPVGDTGLINPWGEHVGISTGENALINTWGSGATPGIYSGGSWTMGSGVSYVAGGTGSTFATITLPLSSLGLSLGSSFYFDVVSSYASPGGQSAYGALDNTGWPAESDSSWQPWLGSNYYDSATDPAGTIFGTSATEYTIVAVPEPATLALLGGGAILLMAVRRNRTR
ncbi:MAG: PEP-CTERM sorting domain-containing protein [Limisphaerales bacterium]